MSKIEEAKRAVELHDQYAALKRANDQFTSDNGKDARIVGSFALTDWGDAVMRSLPLGVVLTNNQMRQLADDAIRKYVATQLSEVTAEMRKLDLLSEDGRLL